MPFIGQDRLGVKLDSLHHIIPVSKMEDILTVAMADPFNVFALDHIAAITKFKIAPVLASEKDIQDAIYEYYEESPYEEIEKVVENMSTPEIKLVEGVQEEQLDATTIMKSTTMAPVVKLANQLLAEAVRMRASDILVEPFTHQTRIRYRIDGILKQIQVDSGHHKHI